MKASEFAASAIDFARPRGVNLCRGEVDAFAGKLVQAGVLEADDNPQSRRVVEVEGVVVETDEDGDLDVSVDGEHAFLLIDEEAAAAARIARALLAWVAAGEAQEEAQAAPEAKAGRELEAKMAFANGRRCPFTFRLGTGSHLHFMSGDLPGGGRLAGHVPAADLAAFCGRTPQAAPEAAQGTREQPYIWRRKTESGGTEEVPVWLERRFDSIYLRRRG